MDKSKVDVPKSGQAITRGSPPLSPARFNPDAGVVPVRPPLFEPGEPGLRWERVVSETAPPLAPEEFNPDPGAWLGARPVPPALFAKELTLTPRFGLEPLPAELRLPRDKVERSEMTPRLTPPPTPGFGLEPLPADQELPRTETRVDERVDGKWHNPVYPLAWQGLGFPPHTIPQTDRWRVPFSRWERYEGGLAETPYSDDAPYRWHPYRQSVLKGDLPVIGQDIFLNLTAAMQTEFEARRLPTPSGVSAARAGSAAFFGQGDQFAFAHNISLALELFRGEAAFQPAHWALRVQPVFNVNYLDVRETGVVEPNPAGGTTRWRHFETLQEYSVEMHLGDLSDNYDFAAARVGSQPFVSDFRGFIFHDVNLGARFFGNLDNNRLQYNTAIFDMREKDTDSQLNRFAARDQRVLIANLYRQDFLSPGYTAQLSFHANFDEGGTHYDRNGNIARPAPLGTVVAHDVNAYYLGWAGDGHLGRLNVSHAFYQALGSDEFNGLAGRRTDINAQMAALELSLDRDWIRYKASFFYASGDGKTEDGTATGFDTIVDRPNFVGGPFSYWVHQGFNLAGTSVSLKQRDSLVPNLRASKTEGQGNFVNPGLFIYGVGADLEVTPKLRSFVNVNYLRFANTDSIRTALLTDTVREEIGWDLSVGFKYRPFLTDNFVVSSGFSALLPGAGFRDIYRGNSGSVPGYGGKDRADSFYYGALLAVTLTY